MSNVAELARRLREIHTAICCLRTSTAENGGYNTTEQLQIDDGGINPSTVTYAAGDFHSLTWSVLTGSVDITIGGVTVEAPTGSGGAIVASTLNENSVTFTIVSGSTHILTLIP